MDRSKDRKLSGQADKRKTKSKNGKIERELDRE